MVSGRAILGVLALLSVAAGGCVRRSAGTRANAADVASVLARHIDLDVRGEPLGKLQEELQDQNSNVREAAAAALEKFGIRPGE